MTGMRRFEDLGAVITGGASGIGLAVAKRIIEEGGSVVIWDQDQAKLDAASRELGGHATAAELDLTDPEAVERATAAAEAALGHVDVLVCSAGVAGLNAMTVDYPIEEWKKVFDVSTVAVFDISGGRATWSAPDKPQSRAELDRFTPPV